MGSSDGSCVGSCVGHDRESQECGQDGDGGAGRIDVGADTSELLFGGQVLGQ